MELLYDRINDLSKKDIWTYLLWNKDGKLGMYFYLPPSYLTFGDLEWVNPPSCNAKI
jgi:hypothetical protein